MSIMQKRSSVGCLRLSVSLFFSLLLLCCFLAATLFFVVSLVIAVQAIRLPLGGGTQTQATIVNVEPVTCGKHNTPGDTYTVQFTDQSGHIQMSTLACEPVSTLSRGSSISIVYNPNSPDLIASPSEAGAFPLAGIAVAVLFALIDLAMLICLIFWLRHEKNILGPLLPGRKRALSHQTSVAGQVAFAGSTSGSYVTDEKWASEKERPEASQPTLFEDQDAQEEEKPFE